MVDNVIVPRRREDFFDSNGDPTLRFIRFLESLTGVTNEGSESIEDNAEAIKENTRRINEIPIYSGFMAQVQFLQRQIDGLPEFTCDTTGFTADTTNITADKVIA